MIAISCAQISRAQSSEELFDFGSSDSVPAAEANYRRADGSGSASGSGDQFETFTEWMTAYNSRVAYRQCMITANYVESKTLACSNILQSTLDGDCIGLPSGECDWILMQYLQTEKEWAAEEEMSEGRQQCACDGSASDCDTCRDAAQENYFKVLNLAQCDSEVEDCGEADAMKALLVQSSTYNAVNGVMDTCMETASGDEAAMKACIDTDMRAALALELNKAVDDIMLQDAMYNSASNAVMNKMNECAANANSAEVLDTFAAIELCVSVNAKAQLATSLGMNADDVSPYMLQDFVQQAAQTRASNQVGSCMDIATNEAERKSCVSGDTLKQTLADSLGKASITEATLQEFVTEAATSQMTSVVKNCLEAITVTGDEKVAEVTKCREQTACAALATSLGKLATELSSFDCHEMMETAERKQVKDQMRACVKAVSPTLDEESQRTARNECKTANAKAALAAMTGGDTSSIETSEMDRYILEAALTEGVPVAMKACMDGIDTSSPEADQATARLNCKDAVAKNALAESLGMLPGDVTHEMAEEAIEEASVAAVRKAFKACAKLSADAKTACLEQASETAARALGQDQMNPVDMASITENAAIENMVQGMRACLSSGTTCDWAAIFAEGSGLEADSADRRGSDTQTVATTDSLKKAAKAMLKRNLQACAYSNDNAASIVACGKSMGQEAFNTLDSNAQSRIEAIARDVLRRLGANRMKACMSDSSMTKTSCMTNVKTLMQNFSATEITDTEVEDAMLTERAAQYSLVFGETGGVGCVGDTDTCLDSASGATTSMGGELTTKWNEIHFNARRSAANLWCSCRDNGGFDETACKADAQALFEHQGGTDWSASQSGTEDLASGYCAGVETTVLREDSYEMIFVFRAACNEIDSSTVLEDVTAAATAVNDDYTVTQDGVPADFSSRCLLKYSVAMTGGYDAAAAASLAQTTVTATLTSGRLTTSTAETSSAQTASECSSCIAPTPAPTEETVVHAYTLSTPASAFDVRRRSDGEVLRNALITAFAGVAGVSESAVTIAYLRAASRRAGTVVGFAVTGTVSTTMHASMMSGAFSNAFVAAAAAAGVTVEAPTITVHCPTGTFTSADGTQCLDSLSGDVDLDSSGEVSDSSNSDLEHSEIMYVFYAGAGVLFVAIVVGLFIGFRRYSAPAGALYDRADDPDNSRTTQLMAADNYESPRSKQHRMDRELIESCEFESNGVGVNPVADNVPKRSGRGSSRSLYAPA